MPDGIDHEALLDAQAQLVRALGYDATGPRLTHAGYLTRALEIFCERDGKYKGVWRQYGALANLVRAAQKIDRTMAVWWFDGEKLPPALDPSHLDDAYDVINHLLFFVICAEAGNLTGEAPDRPYDLMQEIFGKSTSENPGDPFRAAWENLTAEWGKAKQKLKDAGIDVDAIKDGNSNVIRMDRWGE